MTNGTNSNTIQEKLSKTSPAARRMHPYSGQVQKVQQGNSSQLNQQAVNTTTSKPSNHSSKSQHDSFNVTGVTSQASSVMSNSNNSNT